ncbi:unnamed protein product, partial [Sphagnum balticum]
MKLLQEEYLQNECREKHSALISLAAIKQEAVDTKLAHVSALAAVEYKACSLQMDLANVTNTCMQSEQEVKMYKHKMEEMQGNLLSSCKDLQVAKINILQLQQEVCSLKCELEEKEKERISLKRKCDMQCKQLCGRMRQLQIEATHKCEEAVQKVKDKMEDRLQEQIQTHEETIQNMREAFGIQVLEKKAKDQLQFQTFEDFHKSRRKSSVQTCPLNCFVQFPV